MLGWRGAALLQRAVQIPGGGQRASQSQVLSVFLLVPAVLFASGGNRVSAANGGTWLTLRNVELADSA